MRTHVAHMVWLFVAVVLVADVVLYYNHNRIDPTNECTGSNCTGVPPGIPGCRPGVPCEYPETVDFRIVVMTFKRSVSLLKLLQSLNDLVLDGAIASLEIWIDRNKKGEVDKNTLQAATNFKWKLGPTRVIVHAEHVGIYGQWIDTWRPKKDSQELCIFLEDDLSVSPYIWRWLKAVHKTYGDRTDISGYTLQSESVAKASGSGPFQVANDTVFLYRLMGSWGFAPHPRIWRDFQDWFHSVYQKNKSFHPYVDGIIMTTWYKSFEHSKKSDSMWTMWFIKYCDNKNLYCVYNNLNKVFHTKQKCLSVNRMEPGLHFHGKGKDNSKNLLRDWLPQFIAFPKVTAKYEFNGKVKGS